MNRWIRDSFLGSLSSKVHRKKTCDFPTIPTTIQTMGVNITTIAYLRVLIIEIGEKPFF